MGDDSNHHRIMMRTYTVKELHDLLGKMIERGEGHVGICASDGRAYYPFEVCSPADAAGYTEALLITVRPDARFKPHETLKFNQPNIVDWNRKADEIAARCGPFA